MKTIEQLKVELKKLQEYKANIEKAIARRKAEIAERM